MFGGKIITVEEVRRHDDRSHFRLELFRLGPIPVFIPTLQGSWSRATIRSEDLLGSVGCGQLARVTTRTRFGTDSLNLVNPCDVRCIGRLAVVEILAAAWCVSQLVWSGGFHEEE